MCTLGCRHVLCNRHWNSVNLIFCPSVFSMHLIFCTSHQCSLLYVLSPTLWTYTIRRNNLKCFETRYYSKIWWFKWCLHCTLTSRSSTHALQMKPHLHNTASSKNTAWLSLSLILDAYYTVKAMLVSWTRGGCGPYHSNCKAWQNDYSLKSAHPKRLILCLLTHSHVVLAHQAHF